MIKATKIGDWKKAASITGGMTGVYLAASRRSLLKEAQYLRGKMVEGIRSGAPGGKKFKPLSPTTLAIRKFRGRGGRKPLIVTGGLRNSIQVKKIDSDSVFVGVLRTGQGGANVAQMMEDGKVFTVPITRKSRRFLMAVFRKFGGGPSRAGGAKGGRSGKAIAIIRIPPRPFIAPTVEAHAKPADVKKRFMRSLAGEMGYQLGAV